MSKREKDWSKLKERKNRKQRCINAWEVLEKFGMLQKEVAYAIGVHPAYFAKVINREEEATLSSEKLQKLEMRVRTKVVELVKKVFDLGLSTAEVISTSYNTSKPFTSIQENIIKNNVYESVASLTAGFSESPTLPDGVSATTVRIDGNSYCEVYVIVTKRNGKNANWSWIHEYDHLADYFKDKANDLRGNNELHEHPKKGL